MLEAINEEFKILFVVATPFQILTAALVANDYRKKKNNVKVTLIYYDYLASTIKYFLDSTWDEKICIKSDAKVGLRKLLEKILFRLKFKMVFQNIYSQLRYPNIIFVFNDDLPFVQLLCHYYKNSIKVLVEEGITLYSKNSLESKQNLKRYINEFINTYFFGYPVRQIHYGENENIQILLAQFPSKIKNKAKNNKVLCKLNLPSLMKYKYDVIDFTKIPTINNFKCKSMLFLSQCLSEENILSVEEEIDFYRKISVILKKYDITLYIKPHPRDSMEKMNRLSTLGFILSDLQDIPIEIFTFNNEFAYVATLYSAAVLGLSDNSKKTIILGSILNLDIIGLTKSENNFNFINTWEEFERIL